MLCYLVSYGSISYGLLWGSALTRHQTAMPIYRRHTNPARALGHVLWFCNHMGTWGVMHVSFLFMLNFSAHLLEICSRRHTMQVLASAINCIFMTTCRESVAINASLMTLGRCLEALRWNQQHRAAEPKLVPYRESKVQLAQAVFCNLCSTPPSSAMLVNP